MSAVRGEKKTPRRQVTKTGQGALREHLSVRQEPTAADLPLKRIEGTCSATGSIRCNRPASPCNRRNFSVEEGKRNADTNEKRTSRALGFNPRHTGRTSLCCWRVQQGCGHAAGEQTGKRAQLRADHRSDCQERISGLSGRLDRRYFAGRESALCSTLYCADLKEGETR